MIAAEGVFTSDASVQKQGSDLNIQHDLGDDVLSMVYANVEHHRPPPGEQTQFEILKEESTVFVVQRFTFLK